MTFHKPWFADTDYVTKLATTHPELELNCTRFDLPSYFFQTSLHEFLLPGFISQLVMNAEPWFPRLTKPNGLFLGLPFEPYEQTRFLSKNLPSISDVTSQKNLDFVMLTNVDASFTKFSTEWVPKGYMPLLSFPDMIIPLHYNSFSTYISHLNGKSRETIKRNIRKFNLAGLHLESHRNSEEIAQILHEFYYSFYSKAKVKWICHSQNYFQILSQINHNVHLTVAKNCQNEIVGFIINFGESNIWHSSRIGIHPQYNRKSGVYFRLLYHSIEEAIAHQATSLSLGPTTYKIKRQLGAQYNFLYNLILGVSPIWKTLIQKAPLLLTKPLGHLHSTTILEKYF